jgi:hypothetical protein
MAAMKYLILILLAAAAFIIPSQSASAQAVRGAVSCSSIGQSYRECRAFNLRNPQLVRQLSRNPCIANQTWGFIPRSGYLRVSGGFKGVFADVFRPGFRNGFPPIFITPPAPPPPRYRRNNNDDQVDNTPQFDRQGNPNFDTNGNYQGPHGLGKLVGPDDNPGQNPDLCGSDDNPCPGQDDDQ